MKDKVEAFPSEYVAMVVGDFNAIYEPAHHLIASSGTGTCRADLPLSCLVVDRFKVNKFTM